MTSKITFSNIKHTIVKTSSEVTDVERSSGKLYARSIVNRLFPGLRIEAFVLKTLPVFICEDSFTVNEQDIRVRKCFQTVKMSYSSAGKLPVGTKFTSKIKDTDTVIIILHEVEP